MPTTRRQFLAGISATGVVMGAPAIAQATKKSTLRPKFRLAVINDEISPDFDHACSVAANDFGLSWIEIRSMWGKTLADLDAQQLSEAKSILKKYNLRVTDIASPLFKTDWPGAPISKESPHHDQFNADFGFKKQDALLERCIELAKTFDTDRIRCFDFWRLEDPKPYRKAINQKLSEAASKLEKYKLILLLENEMACNTGSGEEALETLRGVPNRNFMLNWDPGNAGTFPNDVPYPDAYNKLPKDRIGHCHVKNVKRLENGKFEWQPVGQGVIDWVGQLKALKANGYRYGVSLETHWHGGGSPEASTRISMKDLKEALTKAAVAV
ncbi:sugar phosphate isomerase/epimerase family protein [Edaphobacter aggregans]|uniref:sugar phosphate isomerase/epimerase family protein n=1 Tax=Edaphobacter aggregans TaxID=570835 RepID=UPI0005537764|nr:sugar phosphate isomerase/epimerase family protein [Edaphobacter aggregans]